MFKAIRLLSIVLVLVLAACGAGPHAITEGTLRDTVFSVEPRQNGTVSVWMTHDDVGVYCTTDKALGDEALRIVRSTNPEVVVTYRSVNNTDAEYGTWLDNSTGCAREGESTTVYKLLSIEQIESVNKGT